MTSTGHCRGGNDRCDNSHLRVITQRGLARRRRRSHLTHTVKVQLDGVGVNGEDNVHPLLCNKTTVLRRNQLSGKPPTSANGVHQHDDDLIARVSGSLSLAGAEQANVNPRRLRRANHSGWRPRQLREQPLQTIVDVALAVACEPEAHTEGTIVGVLWRIYSDIVTGAVDGDTIFGIHRGVADQSRAWRQDTAKEIAEPNRTGHSVRHRARTDSSDAFLESARSRGQVHCSVVDGQASHAAGEVRASPPTGSVRLE